MEFRKRLETRYESASENMLKDARWTYPEQYISWNIIMETETVLSSREESYKAGRVCGAVFIINGKQSRMREGWGNYVSKIIRWAIRLQLFERLIAWYLKKLNLKIIDQKFNNLKKTTPKRFIFYFYTKILDVIINRIYSSYHDKNKC